MLTTDILLAILQGLPVDHLDHLDRPWYLLAVRIARRLKRGLAPPDALHDALDNSSGWERDAYLGAFLQENSVEDLPDLTQRQKEALIALRAAGACSLSQLSRILMQDKSNTSRRLDVLVEKSFVIKYYRRDGPYYLAITSPLSEQHRSESLEIWQGFKEFLIDGQNSDVPSSPNEAVDVALAAEPNVSASSADATAPTTPTTPTTPGTQSQDTNPANHPHPP